MPGAYFADFAYVSSCHQAKCDEAAAQAQRQLDALLLWAFNRSKAKYQQPRNPAGSLFRPWNRKSD